MSVEYDVYYDEVYFLSYLNCENFMKLLNYYDDDVGELYICMCAYMLLVNFLTCKCWRNYWRMHVHL